MAKVVLITGASGGMGKATGELLLKKGYKVYGTSRRPEAHPGHPFPLIRMDLEDPESIASAVNEVLKREGRIDVLVNNAGRGMMGPLAHSTARQVRQLLDTNVTGLLETVRRVLPDMLRRGEGTIVNVSSVAGFLGLPYRGVYSASKAAVMALSEALRHELKGTGIRVADVCPGDIVTGIAANRIYAEVPEDSPFYPVYRRILAQADGEVGKGLPPEAVARTIARIIEHPSPKPRYVVAPFAQKILPLIKAILPARWFEKIIQKHYKL
ncbi:MAG: SDR family oxidoreductase [Chlorobi bacterium]|nr:SDR family oxidoreductase [Chlorobiota bacterium]